MSIDMMSLIIFLSGIFILVYGIFFAPTEEEQKILDNSLDLSGMDNVIKNLENKLSDADKMISEMDKFSEYVTTEMQDKYKEMMFLYQMVEEKEKLIKKENDETKNLKLEIDEKRNALKKEEEKKAFSDAQRRQANMNVAYQKPNVKAYYTPQEPTVVSEPKKEKAPVMVAKSSFDDVVYMYENGKNVEDIAKALGKGKGEIRLMLDLMGKEG